MAAVDSTAPNLTDYHQTCRDFKLDLPADYNFVWDIFEAQAARHPAKPALLSVATYERSPSSLPRDPRIPLTLASSKAMPATPSRGATSS